MADTGRPKLFKSAEDMQVVIDEYFDSCDNRIRHVFSKKLDQPVEMIDPAPYTIMGLARALKMTRQSLLNYEKTEEFFDTIKEAKARVAEDVETRLMETSAAGPIFNLKNNFGYKDSQEITGDSEKPLITLIERVIVKHDDTKD